MSRGRMSRGGGRGGHREGRSQRTPWWTLVVPISYQPLTALLVSRSARTPGVVYGVFVRPGECFIEVGSRPRASWSIVLNSLTTVELQGGELAQELDRLAVAKAVVVHNLLGLRGRDALPVDLVALGLVVEVTAGEGVSGRKRREREGEGNRAPRPGRGRFCFFLVNQPGSARALPSWFGCVDGSTPWCYSRRTGAGGAETGSVSVRCSCLTKEWSERTWYHQSSLRPCRRFPGETGAVALAKPWWVVLLLWCEECVSR